jgi:uncharacterized protein (DUF58 family)
MRCNVIPSQRSLALLAFAAAASAVALFLGARMQPVAWAAGVFAGALFVALVADYLWSRAAWRASEVRVIRRLPAAFAIGVRKAIQLQLENPSRHRWRMRVFDHCDASLVIAGLPLSLTLKPGTRLEIGYEVTPSRRGELAFEPADLRVRSRLGLCELLERAGGAATRRAYPDFAQVARYAWLASDRRLQEIGIKTFQQRGEGTDFKQLAEYRHGDAVRHIDWKATLRQGKPILREFQDERDQSVMLLIDCGRRMRAYDPEQGIGTAHFDQVLNAVMLLSYVALRQGDAVGAVTFGTPEGEGRVFAPRKGEHALNALMGALYSVQPSPTYSDYVSAARDFMRRQHKRSLVIVITNFRDEDGGELAAALKLLRTRHLVLLASLRERIVEDLAAQAIDSADAALEVGSAHLYELARRDAFARLAARDALLVDAAPQSLGIELVNRYHAVKRAGLI